MNLQGETRRLKIFNFGGEDLRVSYVSTSVVCNGVSCDVYSFVGDTTKDLGIVRIQPGCKTPLQEVVKGERTIEGHISGKGTLTIIKPNEEPMIYRAEVNDHKPLMVSVDIGHTMQWEAGAQTELVVFEICSPPYEEGRFKNLHSSNY